MHGTHNIVIARVGLLLLIGLVGVGCAQQRYESKPLPVMNADVNLLGEYLQGGFSSYNQAQSDPENFLDIRLNTARIWEDRDDVPEGVWLYVEQASARALDRPYRQRVYRLTLEDDRTIRSDIFKLPGTPQEFAGAYDDPSVFDGLDPSDLDLREGCSVYLTPDRETGAFIGSTRGDGCASELAGAAYATSEVTVTYHALSSWDRGFDASGEQVWGSTAGPYRFDRVNR